VQELSRIQIYVKAFFFCYNSRYKLISTREWRRIRARLEGVAMGSRRTKKKDEERAKEDAMELALLLYDIYKEQPTGA
jgi:hypothetical protein